MSFLTKLFVVLLVLSAMLLSATTVVFVQKSEDYKVRADASERGRLQAVALNIDMDNQLKTAVRARDAELSVMLADKKNKEQEENELKANIATLQGQIAQITNDKETEAAQITKLTEAVASAQKTNDAQSTELASLRQNDDSLTRKTHDLNDALTEKVAECESVERQLRYAQEQIKDMTDTINRLQQAAPAVASTATPLVPDVAVTGIVSEAQDINGVIYGTITVGSADNIAPKMQLNVVKEGTFIGLITITTVEPHQAVGLLQGPKVSDAQLGLIKGAEVKSRL